MALVRFFSPNDPELELSGVPIRFNSGVADISDTDPARISRMRYLGSPYGVIEMNGTPTTTSGSLTVQDLLTALADTDSSVGAAVLQAAIRAVGAAFVWSGSNADTPRPDVNAQVWWSGTVEPVNMDGDFNDVYVPVSSV